MSNYKKWGKTLFKIVIVIAPFILGFIGYYRLDDFSISSSAYSAIKLYGFDTEGERLNLLIEIGRWTAPLMTATAILMLFKSVWNHFKNRLKAFRSDTCSVYGEGDDATLLLENLGKKGIKGDLKRPVPSTYHILLLDQLTDGLDFYNRHQKWFNDPTHSRELHIHLNNSAGADFQKDNLYLFSMAENCARLYWQTYPPYKNEKIAFIGDDLLCGHLLKQGLLVNIFDRQQKHEYHVFKGGRQFRAQHLYLDDLLSSTQDRLIFHETTLESYHESNSNSDGRNENSNKGSNENDNVAFENVFVPSFDHLKSMDRIILCGQPDDNIQLALTLITLMPKVKLHLYVRQKEGLDILFESATNSVYYYGLEDDLLSPEVIIKGALQKEAKKMHFHYQVRYKTLANWQDLSPFLRQSNLAAADYFPILRKLYTSGKSIEALTELEHIRWCRFYYMYNWQFGPTKDWDRRTHPCLVPFESLSQDDKDKDSENVKLALSL